jgi:glycosyltransferase involved in cell wall biosynthesis
MNRRPRVCVVVTSHITAVTFLKGYLSFLRESGWDVALVCSPGPGLEAFAREEGVRVHTVPMQREPELMRDTVSLMRMIRLMLRLRPDVAVFATPKASLVAGLAAATAGTRVRVYEQWGLRMETSRGLRRRALWAAERVIGALSTVIVPNSPSLAERIWTLGLSGRTPIRVLGRGSSHGVDCDRFSPGAARPALDVATQAFLSGTAGFTVGFIGRRHPDKGIDCLLRALELSSDRGTKVRAIIVGNDEGAPLSALIHGLRGRVPIHVVGEVGDPRPYLAALDVIALPSLREGFPNVILEAAGMAKPAIVANSTGTIDSVLDGLTGFVVPTGDANALANAIQRLALDHRLLVRMGKMARKRVEDDFDQRRVWALHEEFLKTLVAHQPYIEG